MTNTSCPARDDDEKMKELQEFVKSKEVVKELLDSGKIVKHIPRIFHCPPEPTSYSSTLNVPVIDLQEFEGRRRNEIIGQMGRAMETWGMFHVINHGIPSDSMNMLLESSRKFHEMPKELKMEFYSLDSSKPVAYNSCPEMLLVKAAQWRDSLTCHFTDDKIDSQLLPHVCREAIAAYMNCMANLKNTLSDCLLEALGLSSGETSDHSVIKECMESQRLVCHYYPPYPEPHMTQGIVKHTDSYFLNVLLQDTSGGLQVYHQNQWLDVPPVKDSLLVNVGDFLQLISNDKFKSPEHRVIAKEVGPRLSAACFFLPNKENSSKPYGPVQGSFSAKYKETSFLHYRGYHHANSLQGQLALLYFKCSD